MTYDEFKSEFEKENKKLKIALCLSLVIFSLGTFVNLIHRQYYLYQKSGIFEERLTNESVCLIGFQSIVDGEPNSKFLTDDMMGLLKNDPFTLNVDKYLEVKSLDLNNCRILLKSENGPMSYKILLDENKDYPFHYKIAQVDEIDARNEEVNLEGEQ